MEKAVFNWSGGKDSALALHRIQKEGLLEIQTLLTSVNAQHDRVSMHGVRRELLHQQAESIQLPLQELMLPENPDMQTYNQLLADTMRKLQDSGVTHSIFGDIFLEDLRAYREEKLREIGMFGVFPLWKGGTRDLIEEFLELGFKTIVVCVNGDFLDASFVGRVIDEQFLADLPGNVDPCGENGEFHTFVFDGPIFSKPVAFEVGEVVTRTYPKPKSANETCHSDEQKLETEFYFIDLLPLR